MRSRLTTFVTAGFLLLGSGAAMALNGGASLGLGGWLSGLIGVYWERLPHSQFFLMIVGILIIVAVPLSLLTPQIKRTMQRAEA